MLASMQACAWGVLIPLTRAMRRNRSYYDALVESDEWEHYDKFCKAQDLECDDEEWGELGDQSIVPEEIQYASQDGYYFSTSFNVRHTSHSFESTTLKPALLRRSPRCCSTYVSAEASARPAVPHSSSIPLPN